MTSANPDTAIWRSLGLALGADPREHKSITGASGIDHAVEAIAVDDKGGRVIVVSGEANPKVAALVQTDIQAAMPGVHVIVARPVVVDLPAIARNFVQKLGSSELRLTEISKQMDDLKKAGKEPNLDTVLGGVLVPSALAFSNLRLPWLNQLFSIIQQFANLDWPPILEEWKRDPSNLSIPLLSVLSVDNMALDREFGVCPLPLYELTPEDWALFQQGSRIDAVEERLRALGIYQYFFPPPDHLALALADRKHLDREAIAKASQLSPAMGHPFGKMEIVGTSAHAADVADALQHMGFLVEGEYGLEVTEAGAFERAIVKWRPREGLVSKLIQRVKITINLSGSVKDIAGS
jgi:hypothetical protein